MQIQAHTQEHILTCQAAMQAKAPLGDELFPSGVDRRAVRPRVGRCGRLLFDRVDAATLEPLFEVLEPGQDGKSEGSAPQVWRT